MCAEKRRKRAAVVASNNDNYSDTDVQALVISHYAAALKMSYDTIQAITGLSRTTIAKRLQYAKDRGWLEQRLVFKLPQMPDEARRRFEAQIHDLRIQSLLMEHLQQFGLRSAIVVSDREAVHLESRELTERVSQAAAARLSQALTNRRGIVGINWGYATKYTVEHLAPEKTKSNLILFPLMGQFSVNQRETVQFAESIACSANRLVAEAASRLKVEHPVMLTAPAVISRTFANKPALDTIWDWIEDDYSYRTVFGRGHHRQRSEPGAGDGDAADQDYPLIEQADTIITGISGLHPASALVSVARLVSEAELAILRNANFVADIGGHPISDRSVKVTDEKALEIEKMLDQLLVSPSPKDFINVAARARLDNTGQTGVFLIARGAQKGPGILAAVRLGAVNEICTDRPTAAEMLRLMGVSVPEDTAEILV